MGLSRKLYKQAKMVLRPVFHEEANGPIPEALRASFVNFQAN